MRKNLTVKVIGDLSFSEADVDFMIKGMEEGVKLGSLIKTNELTRELIFYKIQGAPTKFGDRSTLIKNFYLVAYLKNERVGFVEITYYQEFGNFEVHYIYVKEKFRNKKIASFLIKNAFVKIVSLSKTANLTNPKVFGRVLTAIKNIPSETLFKSLNFEKSNTIYPHYVWYEISMLKAAKINGISLI